MGCTPFCGKIWLDRNVVCTPFAARVLPTIASSWGNCLCLSFSSVSLRVVLYLGRAVSFESFLGSSHASKGLLNTAGNMDCLSWLKPDKIFERILKRVSLWLEVDQIEN